MYSTTSNKGTFFQNEKAKEISTDKCIFGNFSQKVKDSRAKDGYTYENWSVRICGVALGKALTLPLKNKDFIQLKAWSVHNPYNKEKDRNEPYIMITDFDLITDEQGQGTRPTENINLSDFVEIGSEEELPFV